MSYSVLLGPLRDRFAIDVPLPRQPALAGAAGTLPLTRAAKMLMMSQAALSVVTLTGIVRAAINILAGNG